MSLKSCIWYLSYDYAHKQNGVCNLMNNILYLHPLLLEMGGKQGKEISIGK